MSAEGTKGKADKEQHCVVCSDAVGAGDALALSCSAKHVMCCECSAVYADSVLSGGVSAFPPKCSLCRGPVPLGMFERILNPEQHTIYLNLVAMTQLSPGETVVNCTHCPYFEIRTDLPALFWCANCTVAHCHTCKATLPKMDEAGDDEDEDDFLEKQGSNSSSVCARALAPAESLRLTQQSTTHTLLDPEIRYEAEVERHLKCGVLGSEKELFDKALATGSQMPCPSCGVSGRKDGMCTHMSCACGTVWCYICGMSESECDKAPRTAGPAGIYQHNNDFERNLKRCPMYLNQIQEVDEAWRLNGDEADEEDEEKFEEFCVSKLHRWRTLRLLKKVKDDMGAEKWEELKNTFPSVRHSGFADDEIDDADVLLFARKL